MAKSEANGPILLHFEHETAQKVAYERMDSEPARWFLRFRTYLLLGHNRSLQAAVAHERGLLDSTDAYVGQEEKALLGTIEQLDDESGLAQHVAEFETQRRMDALEMQRDLDRHDRAKGVTVPGSWRRASKQWNWVARAAAYDEQVRRESHQALMGYVDHSARYVTKAQRLATLDALAGSLMMTVINKDIVKNDVKTYLACVRELHALLRDIRKEMSSLDLSSEGRKPYHDEL